MLLLQPSKQIKVIRNFSDGIHMELGLYVREKLDTRKKNECKIPQSLTLDNREIQVFEQGIPTNNQSINQSIDQYFKKI